MSDNSDSRRRALTIFGVLLVTIGISLSVMKWYFGWPLSVRTQYEYHPRVRVDSTARLGGEPGPEEHRPRLLAIVHIDLPPIVDLDESGYVSLSATQTDGGFSEPDLPEVSLSGAGLEVKPEGYVSLQRSDIPGRLTANWTIRAKETGRYKLVVNFKDKAVQSTNVSGLRRSAPVEFRPIAVSLGETSTPLEVRFKRTLGGYVAQIWPILVTVMGSLLTVPGIIAFLKERSKEKEERESKKKEEVKEQRYQNK
jgi:hypothetical protein